MMYDIYCGLRTIKNPERVLSAGFPSLDEALQVARQEAKKLYKSLEDTHPLLMTRDDVVQEYLSDTGFPEDHDLSESIDANNEIDDWYEEIVDSYISYYCVAS